ncbi:MAG TPA: hypothetical protein VGE07_03060 [Herpetosiphonaceae bacterium]
MRIGSLSWGLARFFRAQALGIAGRCPVCGHGKLFRSFFKIHDSCPYCQASFIGSGNQSTGAMGINVVVTVALGFAGGVWLVLALPDFVGWGLLALFALLTLFHIVFYHFAYGMWIGILAITGDLDEDPDRL